MSYTGCSPSVYTFAMTALCHCAVFNDGNSKTDLSVRNNVRSLSIRKISANIVGKISCVYSLSLSCIHFLQEPSPKGQKAKTIVDKADALSDKKKPKKVVLAIDEDEQKYAHWKTWAASICCAALFSCAE